MIDIFKLFRVENKEDIYTFCLKAMLETGNLAFKKRIGEQFGFNDDFQVARSSFSLSLCDGLSQRKQITPDLVLFNRQHLAIVESKMFSSEGYLQTNDYESGVSSIKSALNIDSANSTFYFLTLSGIKAQNKNFIPVKWTDFYDKVLRGISFEDEALEVIRKTILSQTEKYKEFEDALITQPYYTLFDEDSYWITPLTLFSSGVYNNIWEDIDKDFVVSNSSINGSGHSEFVTNLDRNSWWNAGKGKYDNIHLFIRIEWSESPTVWLCWEYYDCDSWNYIPTAEIEPKELQNIAVESLRCYKIIWSNNNLVPPMGIRPTPKKASSIKALKCQISSDRSISEVINDIEDVVIYYSEEINRIIQSLIIDNNILRFNKHQYGFLTGTDLPNNGK